MNMETCFRVFMLLNYMKAYVSMYFLHLMLTFPPQNDVMVNDPLCSAHWVLDIQLGYASGGRRKSALL